MGSFPGFVDENKFSLIIQGEKTSSYKQLSQIFGPNLSLCYTGVGKI